jgi:hypothetical protein
MKQLVFDREYMEKLKLQYNSLRKTNQTQSKEMDVLRTTIHELRQKNSLCDSEKQSLLHSFEGRISTMSGNMKRYAGIIQKIKGSAEETNQYMKRSTTTINGILKNYCDTTPNDDETYSIRKCRQGTPQCDSCPVELVGGGKDIDPPPLNKKQFTLLSRRKRNRPTSITTDFDNTYDMNNRQWVLLSECIDGMNQIADMDVKQLRKFTQPNTTGRVSVTPDVIKKHSLERTYLLFLKELQYLTKIPRKDFLYLKNILRLPPELMTIHDLKIYLSDDMYRLNKILVTK